MKVGGKKPCNSISVQQDGPAAIPRAKGAVKEVVVATKAAQCEVSNKLREKWGERFFSRQGRCTAVRPFAYVMRSDGPPQSKWSAISCFGDEDVEIDD